MVHREWEASWRKEPLPLLGPWLRYEGPISLARIAEVFGVSLIEAEDAVNALAEVEEVIRDVQVAHVQLAHVQPAHVQPAQAASPLVCDSRNLEMLLRLSRRKQRPEIIERPSAILIPFLALRQGLLTMGNENTASGEAAIKKLHACCAPVKLWETEFLTARCARYSPEIINREISEGRLVWYGAGKEKIGLCRPDDLELVNINNAPKSGQKPDADNSSAVAIMARLIDSGFFDRPRDFWEIKDAVNASARQSVNSKDCAAALWKEAWQGRLSSDSFEPLRRGVQNGFTVKSAETVELNPKPDSRSPRMPHIPRSLRERWRDGAPVSGRWFSIILDEAPVENNAQSQWWDDPLDEEGRNRDRVRLLLARWGILCRPLFE
jgi:ATP-dependent Lhr-like helicase